MNTLTPQDRARIALHYGECKQAPHPSDHERRLCRCTVSAAVLVLLPLLIAAAWSVLS